MWTSGFALRYPGGHEKRKPMATLVELRCEIDARMQRGASFSSIEDDVIETSGLPADQKSALWLYGWSFVALDAQRREADAHIVQIAARCAAARSATGAVAGVATTDWPRPYLGE
jgi:hypothetical protein